MDNTDIFLDRDGRAYRGIFYFGTLLANDIVLTGERIIREADEKIFVVTDRDLINGTLIMAIEQYDGDDEQMQKILHDYQEKRKCKVPAHDAVEHPAHYETGKFECIDVMLETQGKQAVTDFCVCNAFKYLYRHGRKNGVEDLKKARWYLDKAIGLIEGE